MNGDHKFKDASEWDMLVLHNGCGHSVVGFVLSFLHCSVPSELKRVVQRFAR